VTPQKTVAPFRKDKGESSARHLLMSQSQLTTEKENRMRSESERDDKVVASSTEEIVIRGASVI
jgi:hypothetical protein